MGIISILIICFQHKTFKIRRVKIDIKPPQKPKKNGYSIFYKMKDKFNL